MFAARFARPTSTIEPAHAWTFNVAVIEEARRERAAPRRRRRAPIGDAVQQRSTACAGLLHPQPEQERSADRQDIFRAGETR
jgi:hypothetical protein